MTDREKLIVLLDNFQCPAEGDEDRCNSRCNVCMADHLLTNGVTFATDTNVGSKWISVEDEKPPYWVSILGHMTDTEDFPAVRECFFVNEEFWFPALHEAHPVDRWMEMPE